MPEHWSIFDNVYACKKYEIWNEIYLSLSCYRILFWTKYTKSDCEAYFPLRFKDNKDIKNTIYNISKKRKLLFTLSLNFYWDYLMGL